MIITTSIKPQNRTLNPAQKKNPYFANHNTALQVPTRKISIYDNNKISTHFALSFRANNNIEVLKAFENLDESLKSFDRNVNFVSLNYKTDKVRVKHNKQLEKDLDTIFNQFPVLKPTIERNNSHNSKLVTHLLEVTKELVTDPEFQNLPPESKRLARICSIFHDAEKRIYLPERGKDHPEIGAKTVVREFSKLGFNEKDLFAMHQIVKNHHWVGQLNTGVRTADDIALEFKDCPEAFDISVMLSKADIQVGGNPDYIRDFKEIFHPGVTTKIKEKMKELQG